MRLLDRWGLGHSKCHDGLLLVYVAADGDVSLKWYVRIYWLLQ